MFRQNHKWIQFGLVCAFMLASGIVAHAQCNPGVKVEYKAQRWPEVWEVGTCLKVLPGGTQVLVAQKPTEFYPEGFQRAYSLDEIRPVQKAEEPALKKDAPANPDVPAGAGKPLEQPRNETPANDGGGGPMSQEEVLGFLQQRLGNGDPFMNPKREQVLNQLREEVLRRGVNFRYQTLGSFSDQLAKFGALSNVRAPLAKNFGGPARLEFLFGRWDVAKIGGTTEVSRGGQLYQRQEYAGLAGSLTVNQNGSYVWDSPSGVFQGRWRPATPEEMAKSDRGGQGVVLLNAKSGSDWIVFERNDEGQQGKDGVRISDLYNRGITEIATRN